MPAAATSAGWHWTCCTDQGASREENKGHAHEQGQLIANKVREQGGND